MWSLRKGPKTQVSNQYWVDYELWPRFVDLASELVTDTSTVTETETYTATNTVTFNVRVKSLFH